MTVWAQIGLALAYAGVGAALAVLFCRQSSGDAAGSSETVEHVKDADDKARLERPCDEGSSKIEEQAAEAPVFLDRPAAIKLLYGTQTNHARDYAFQFFERAATLGLPATEPVSLSEYDPEDLFTEDALCVFLIASYTDGGPTDGARWFHRWLADAVTDFRIQKDALAHLQFAVVGLGDSLYGENFCRAAKEVYERLVQLSAKPVYRSVMCDDQSDPAGIFEEWQSLFLQHLQSSERLSVVVDREMRFESEDECDEAQDVGDLEDLVENARTGEGKSWNPEQRGRPAGAERQMVTPALRKALTKQGYKIVGSHSGVKVCRWTKSMLRGRGGCYKHTFYGIASHRCMETTPSLACANKCVFCWRHHTNPVGTTWRWQTDAPEAIVAGATEGHLRMIRELRGLPGLVPERFEEAQRIRHCALSLVGEPIMYPHVNELVDLLHARHISTFLVTNAQFPEHIAALKPITQLYVSIDAPSKERLKAIDRPLFGDFWERYLGSLQALATKQQRTVFRLTLVKGYNVADIDGYAGLVRLGRPDFIEVKGVTFCGSSGANPLTMSHVPFHREVVDFVQQLCAVLEGRYAIACEHEHSCSLLLASRKFFVDNAWHTWIDYDRFDELVQSGKPFTSLDYIARTPPWAVYGAAEHGFDPVETRFLRKRSAKEQPVDHGC